MAKLLIVDDEKNIRRTLASYLQSLGHRVELAENGKHALELIAATDYDVVLSDYRMAETNGLELLQEISGRSSNLLVILMTAYGTVEGAGAAKGPSRRWTARRSLKICWRASCLGTSGALSRAR
jgi:DNA-binding NtrC family response regulator